MGLFGNFNKIDWKKADKFAKKHLNFELIPGINFKCGRCKFEWIMDVRNSKVSFKEVYKKNEKCPKCKSYKVLYLIAPPSADKNLINKDAAKDFDEVFKDDFGKCTDYKISIDEEDLKQAEELLDDKTAEELISEPDVVLECDKCKLKRTVNIGKLRILLRELYEKNAECPKCKSNNISFIVVWGRGRLKKE